MFLIGYGIVDKKYFNDIIINELLEIIENLTYDYHEIYVDCYGELEKALFERLKVKSRKNILPIFSLETSQLRLNSNTIMNKRKDRADEMFDREIFGCHIFDYKKPAAYCKFYDQFCQNF